MPVGDEAFVCHVGDSRLYLLRGGELFQVTEDHSLVNRLLQQGQISPEAAAAHPHKNLITRCVGIQPEIEVDSLYLDLQVGDRFVLCSDGLSDMLSFEELRELCRAHAGERLVAAALEAANDAGGSDNITVVVLEVGADRVVADRVEADRVVADRVEADRVVADRVEADRVEADRAGVRRAEPHPARLGVLQRVEFLQDIFLFSDLTDQECVKVNGVLYEERHPGRRQILRKGDPGSEFYIVVDGSGGIWDGQVRLTSIGPGGHFGEFALLEDQPRSADAWAEIDTVLLVIRRADFLELIATEPVLGNKVYQAFLKHLADRVRDLTVRLGRG